MRKMRLKGIHIALIIIGLQAVQCSSAPKKSGDVTVKESESQKEYNAMALNYFMEGSLLDVQEE